MAETLLNKIWRMHSVRELASGQTQLFIGLHLIHEVTSPQAFQMLLELGLRVRFPQRTFATIDHIVPTKSQLRPFADRSAEEMAQALINNCRAADIQLFDLGSGQQGIVHVIGPELGLTQPGMTVACGDSHTSTHGALGALAFGIGTSQVRDVLATQCVTMTKPKVRRLAIDGVLSKGVYAKDVVLAVIQRLGVKGGIGYAYEFGGAVVDAMSMEERMTLCNMSIEGGARVGYVNPDERTFDYLLGRQYTPKGEAFERAVSWWKTLASDANADYDDEIQFDGQSLQPMVTWGINPGQSIGISEIIPPPDAVSDLDRSSYEEALSFMSFKPNQTIVGIPIDVAFIGSCTNARLSDLRVVAEIVRGRKVAPHVRALIVPGSEAVAASAEAEGLHEIFGTAGFQWRKAGCSMCIGMNADKLNGREICASSSNRNFKGRQGSPSGRTLLMSPAMVAAAAVAGEIVDVRVMLQ